MEGPSGWDLSVVFADDATAVTEAAALVTLAAELAAGAKDALAGNGAGALIQQFAEVDARVEGVHDYARMRQYADANGEGVQEVVITITASVTAAKASLERILDEWRALSDVEAEAILAIDTVEPASYRLAHARRLAAHRLTEEGERVWTARTEAARTRWGSLNDNVEGALLIPFDDGTGERLWGIGDLGTLVRRPEPEVRRAAYARARGRLRLDQRRPRDRLGRARRRPAGRGSSSRPHAPGSGDARW